MLSNKTRPAGRVFVCSGFTIVELVVTIIILGVIATVAAPKFFGKSSYDETGFARTTLSALGYAQKLALSRGCDTRVNMTSSSIALYQRVTSCYSGTMTSAVVKVTGGDFSEAVPAGLAVENFDIYFDSRGRPRYSSDGSLLLTAEEFTIGSKEIKVEAETGYVYVN